MSAPKNRAARARAAADHRASAPSRSRSLAPVIAVVAVIVVAVVVALLASGGDDGGDDTLATAGVTVRGSALPQLPQGGPDPGTGAEAPTLEGVSPAGTPTTVSPTGEPTLLAFLAHWCPACQAELPHLVDLQEAGDLDGLRSVAVLTGTDRSRPNYPPGEWVEEEGWSGEVLLDDERSPAATAFGLTSYPYLVLLDGEGKVIARSAGSLGPDGLRALVSLAG